MPPPSTPGIVAPAGALRLVGNSAGTGAVTSSSTTTTPLRPWENAVVDTTMWCASRVQLSLYPQWTKDVFHHKPTWHHIVGISQYTVCPNNINNISPKLLQRVQGFGPLKPFEAQERSHLKRHSAVAPFLVRFPCTLSCLGLEGYRYRKHLFHLQRTACNPDAPSKN